MRNKKLPNPRRNPQAKISKKMVILSIQENLIGRKSKGSIYNIVSGFRKIIEAGLVKEDQIEYQFTDGFSDTQARVKEYTREAGSVSWNSFLKDIHIAVDALLYLEVESLTFAEYLTFLLKLAFGYALGHYTLARAIIEDINSESPVEENSIVRWMRGKSMPGNSHSARFVKELDHYFGCDGALSNMIQQEYQSTNSAGVKSQEVTVLPKLLALQFEEYAGWKMDRKRPNISFPYKNDMSHRELRSSHHIDDKKWSCRPDGSCASYETTKSKIGLFVKIFKINHPDLVENMTIYDLFDHIYIDDFVQYLKENKKYSSGLRLLEWVISETKINRYIYVYGSLPEYKTKDDWINHLGFLSSEIKIYITELKDEKNLYGGDLEGNRNIKNILNSSNPKKSVKQISNELKKRVATATREDRVMCATRDSLIFDLSVPVPLRMQNYLDLEWAGVLTSDQVEQKKKSRVCFVYESKEDSCYGVFVHKIFLKNRRSTKISNIHIKVFHLNESFDIYLKARDVILKSSNVNSDIFFCAAKNQAKAKDRSEVLVGGRLISISTFPKSTKVILKKLFPKQNIEYGINIHALRHLSATLYLFDNPSNFSGLATLLMDDLGTVMNVYADRSDQANSIKISQWATSYS